MNRNILSKLTMATITTFIVTGTAMADVPYGFDNYTVAGGIISDTGVDPDGAGPLDACQAGFTCQRMEADGQGIMQRNVTDTGSGVSYLQTVVVDSSASGAAATLGFSDENFVFAAGINSNNIAAQQRINDAGMSTLTTIQEGAFQTGGDETDPASTTGDGIVLHLNQTVSLGSPDFQEFIQVGSNANVQRAINQRTSGQGTDNRFTVRVATGSFGATASGTLGDNTFENETLAGPGGVDYTPGDNLKVVWIGQDAPDGSQFGTQDYINITTGEVTNRTGQTGAMGEFTDNGPWLWNTTFFGNAPAAPPTTPAFP